MQLVVLAAGMGSRFGGLKQLEKMDEWGNTLLDYSSYDAYKAGFDSVVFIIKKDFFEEFRDTIGSRVSKRMKVEYAFQDINDLPAPYKSPEGREKPWGTAHAIYAARDLIKEDFIIINGDDFYGRDAFKVAHDYLASLKGDKTGKYANVAFQAKNTMTENGSVKRGVCFEKGGMLTKLVEATLTKDGDKIDANPLEGGEPFKIDGDQLVSMNLFCFTLDLNKRIAERFPSWLAEHGSTLKDEFLIPSVVDELVAERKASVTLLSTTSTWFGVTYKEDKPAVVASLKALVDKGEYPKGL